MGLFSKEILERAVELHQIEGRMEWKYLPMTDKQWEILEPHLPEAMREHIDRGAAAMLIQHKFDEDRYARAYGCCGFEGGDMYYDEDDEDYPMWADSW